MYHHHLAPAPGYGPQYICHPSFAPLPYVYNNNHKLYYGPLNDDDGTNTMCQKSHDVVNKPPAEVVTNHIDDDNTPLHSDNAEHPIANIQQRVKTVRSITKCQQKVLEKSYVALDVEVLEPGVLLSVAFVECKYPSGIIVSMNEFHFDCSSHHIEDARSLEFWNKNKAAFDHCINRGRGCINAEVEKNICMFVEAKRRQNPMFYLISDNHDLDLRMVNQVLTSNGYAGLSDRGEGRYVQALCAWTYRYTLATTLNVVASKIFTAPCVKKLMRVPPDLETYCTQRPVELSAAFEDAIKHTPLHDCVCMLSSFFKCMDINTALAQTLQETLFSSFAINKGTKQTQTHSRRVQL